IDKLRIPDLQGYANAVSMAFVYACFDFAAKNGEGDRLPKFAPAAYWNRLVDGVLGDTSLHAKLNEYVNDFIHGWIEKTFPKKADRDAIDKHVGTEIPQRAWPTGATEC